MSHKALEGVRGNLGGRKLELRHRCGNRFPLCLASSPIQGIRPVLQHNQVPGFLISQRHWDKGK